LGFLSLKYFLVVGWPRWLADLKSGQR